MVVASFETVVSGAVSGVLLLDELDCALTPGAHRRRNDPRLRDRSTG